MMRPSQGDCPPTYTDMLLMIDHQQNNFWRVDPQTGPGTCVSQDPCCNIWICGYVCEPMCVYFMPNNKAVQCCMPIVSTETYSSSVFVQACKSVDWK